MTIAILRSSDVPFLRTSSPCRVEYLLPLPARLPLLNEGANSFFGIERQHVFHHDARGVIVGVRETHFELLVKRALASFQRERRFSRDGFGHTLRVRLSLSGQDDAVDEAEAVG